MDKNAIKKYAVWARNELIARVTQKAAQYEITEKKTTPKDSDSIGGRLLTEAEKKQRKALIEKIEADGFEQVMEEVAYTWFNRFTALRFMEVNNYLPSHTRVFTNESGEFKPQILADAIQLNLEGLNMDKVFELKDANKTEELYKYLLITQCNSMSAILPRMFQKIEHYTELLLPDYLLREGSVIEQMIALVPEKDWMDQVQIIGWLYQYYNSEPKDKVFGKKGKFDKEEIPAATQLFTPDWIVRYMVENSLGNYWLDHHNDSEIQNHWNYYISNIARNHIEDMNPSCIRFIDPCAGSGHVLCYAFDVFVQIYEKYGYSRKEAVQSIIENNIYGLDIDERAAQLSYFSVMMKARQYDRRFFNKKDVDGELSIPQPHIFLVRESNGITVTQLQELGKNMSADERELAEQQASELIKEFRDAKEYGSMVSVKKKDWNLLRRFASIASLQGQQQLDFYGIIDASERICDLIDIGEVLAQKYDVISTNPPYMKADNMPAKLAEYVLNYNEFAKYDLYSAFIYKCYEMLKKGSSRIFVG